MVVVVLDSSLCSGSYSPVPSGSTGPVVPFILVHTFQLVFYEPTAGFYFT